MPVLRIGGTAVEYELRRSAKASERKITVTPGHVEVLALATDNDQDISEFLDRKRQWLLTTVREMDRALAGRHAVPRFVTGSKIPFRGRKMSLTVRRSDAERAAVSYRNGFFVDLPHWAKQDADNLVASELKHWLKQCARRDVSEMAAVYGRKFALFPRTIRSAEFASGWGSCGAEGNVLINWHLIFAPRKVMEYVVAHELAHLRLRSHGREFWEFLGSIMPDYLVSKSWLERHEASLTDAFLV